MRNYEVNAERGGGGEVACHPVLISACDPDTLQAPAH